MGLTFLKKYNLGNNAKTTHSEMQRASLSIQTHSNRTRQTNILNIPKMSPLFKQKQNKKYVNIENENKMHQKYSFSMIDSMLNNENSMIPKETHKTVKIYRKSILSDICSLFYSSKYFSPLLSYYQFQTFRYHTSDAMPS